MVILTNPLVLISAIRSLVNRRSKTISSLMTIRSEIKKVIHLQMMITSFNEGFAAVQLLYIKQCISTKADSLSSLGEHSGLKIRFFSRKKDDELYDLRFILIKFQTIILMLKDKRIF